MQELVSDFVSAIGMSDGLTVEGIVSLIFFIVLIKGMVNMARGFGGLTK